MPKTSRLRNVTVTMEEDVARWARIEAARQDTSVSRLLGELLKERMAAQDGYEKAMHRSLDRKPFLSGDPPPTSDATHDRATVAGAADRLANFGKRRKLSLGDVQLKTLVNKGRR